MEGHPRRAEAERLLGIAEKLLQGQDFNGSRDFAILAQETEPLLEGPDQILAVAEVLLAAQKRINNHHDWYAILQVDRRSDDLEVIKRQYRRLALLLHPDKNKFALADAAFRFVAAAWAVLSDTGKKTMYDNELGLFSKVDLVASKNQRGHHPHQFHQFRREQEEPQPPPQQQEFPVRRSSQAAEAGAAAGSSSAKRGGTSSGEANFWTACPYCYNLFEYPKAFVDCCLRCQNCDRAFHAATIPSLPPLVPGKEAYYCCWGFFPMGFTVANGEVGSVKKKAGVPKSMAPPPPPPTPPPPPPPPQPQPQPVFPTSAAAGPSGGGGGGSGFVDVSGANATPAGSVNKKRGRGRPKKNVQV